MVTHAKIRKRRAHIAEGSSAHYRRASAEMQKKQPNIKKVATLLREAADEGDANAAYALATWYLHGKEPYIKRSLREGTRLLRLAAAAKIADALYDLGVSYERGWGVKKDTRRAFILYLQAALRGDARATFEVGLCLRHGAGTIVDKAAAKIWIQRAKELGYEEE